MTSTEGKRLTKIEKAEAFERWWKRVKDGCPLTDDFEIGVVRAHAELAFNAAFRIALKTGASE